MKIIVSTSNSYHHLLKIFIYLFNKNWSNTQEVEIVGYKKPDFELPSNFTFVSLGEQVGDAKNFTRDLRGYFAKQDEWFIWMMEDTFIRSVDRRILTDVEFLTQLPITDLGRINLCSKAGIIQDHIEVKSSCFKEFPYQLIENTQTALYRLCTQPSLWNKNFLLQYMQEDMTPWEFETQPSFNDGWRIFSINEDVVLHNEGVTKWDIHKYNLSGIPEEQINEMKQLNIL